MKKILWFLTILAALAGGFFAGKYYEAHREWDQDDMVHAQGRIAARASQMAGEMADKIKGALGAD